MLKKTFPRDSFYRSLQLDTVADDGETVFADDLDCLRRTLHISQPVQRTSNNVPDTIQVDHGGQHARAISLLRQLGQAITPDAIKLVETQLGTQNQHDSLDDTSTSTDAKEQKENARLRYKMSDFPKFPKDHRDPTAYDRWRQSLYHRLHIPWWQYEGRNVCDLQSTPPDAIGGSISQALLFHLTKAVHASHNPVAIGLLSTLCHGDDPHDGIELLVALDHDARQRTSAALLQDYGDWQALTHKNREHIVTLQERLTDARDRLARNKYIVSDFQFRVKLYHCIMDGPYGAYLHSLSTDLDMGRLDLITIPTATLYSQMYELFMAKCFDGTRLLPGKTSTLAQKASSDGGPEPTTKDSANTTQPTVHELHRQFACIFCRIPRTKVRPRPPGFHYTPGCQQIRACGLTITWSPQNDTVCPKSDQPFHPQRGRKTGTTTKTTSTTQTTSNERPPTPKPTQGWADTDDEASHSTKSSEQSSPYSPRHVGRRVSAWCFRSSNMKAHPREFVCPDSGATSDMFWDEELFTTYVRAHNEFVELGDGHSIQIMGRGTVEFTLDGHRVRLLNCLHVPQLDVHLLSIRLHRRRGPGCTFICDESGMFLTFPSFTIEVDDVKDALIPVQASDPTQPLAYDQTSQTSSSTVELSNHALRICSRKWRKLTCHHNRNGVFARAVTTRHMSKTAENVPNPNGDVSFPTATFLRYSLFANAWQQQRGGIQFFIHV